MEYPKADSYAQYSMFFPFDKRRLFLPSPPYFCGTAAGASGFASIPASSTGTP